MKKWISFMMILFLAVIFVGCGDKPDKPNPKPNVPTEIKVTSIEVTGVKEELEEGESFTLEIKVLPENATNKNYRVAAVDTSVLKVEDKKVTALKGGETTLTVTPLGNTQLKKEFKITVKGKEAPVVKPTKIEITSSTNEVEVSKVLTLGLNFTPENASKAVVWSSSDEKIAKVNKGLVIGIAEGEVTITATSTLDEKVKAEYKVKVIPAQGGGEIEIAPTDITIQVSAEEVEVGYKLTAKATVFPNGASQSIRWESRSPEIATINERGIIVGVSVGTTYITAYSTVDESVKSAKVKVKVTPNTDPETYPDMKGYKIILMNAESALADLDPFLDAYTGQDKMYKQKAWKEVEDLYNCKISVVAYPTEAPWGTQRIQWINSQAELGEAKADFYTISTAWMPDIAGVGSAHDAKLYYAKYGKNQMEIILKQASTFRGGLYGLSTGPNEAKNYTDLGLYYNLGWVEKLKLESPAKLFNEGKWTYSTFINWVNSCQALLDEGQYTLAGHYYYYWLGMSNAAGVKIANTAAVSASLTHPRSKAVAEMLKGFVASGALATSSTWMEESGEFFDSKAVMTTGSWWFLKTDNRWRTDMWGEDTRFGYVPFPYPDDMTKDQTRIGEYGTTMLIFASGRDSAHPAGVSYEIVYQAMVDYYLKAARYYSEDPTYDPETLKRNAISAKVDDLESVEAAMWWNNSNCFYDAAHDFYTSIATSPIRATIINIINNGKDYDQSMDALEDTYINKFYQTYSS